MHINTFSVNIRYIDLLSEKFPLKKLNKHYKSVQPSLYSVILMTDFFTRLCLDYIPGVSAKTAYKTFFLLEVCLDTL